jgi:hypothetical protein
MVKILNLLTEDRLKEQSAGIIPVDLVHENNGWLIQESINSKNYEAKFVLHIQ